MNKRWLGLFAIAAMMTACASEATVEGESETHGAIVRDEIITRGQSWIDEKVPYSQSATHKNKYGSYRTDCSGFVSMAWGLSSSMTTFTLGSVTKSISANDLQPGDALLLNTSSTNGHVALFVGWDGKVGGKPIVMEEYSSGHNAEKRTWSSLRGFHPLRFTGADGTASKDPGNGGGGADDGAGLPVLLTWNGVANNEASIDLILTGGRTIGPCIAVEVLRDEFDRGYSDGLGYLFTGKCVSPDITPNSAEIEAFQVCTAANDDWAHAKCTRSAKWNHTNDTVHIDN